MPLSLLPSLLLSILLVGFTPGPANLFSLRCSVRYGVKKALGMWLGLLAGFSIAAVIGAILTHFVGEAIGKWVPLLKYLGCGYMLYLAFEIWRSAENPGKKDRTCTFSSGMIVQLTNAKIILFDLMVYSTFVLPYSHRLSDLLAAAAVLEIAGPGANLAYILFGGSIRGIFDRHPRKADAVMAVLLALCALWILFRPVR